MCCGLGVHFGGVGFVCLLFHVLSMEKPLWLEQSPTSGGGGVLPWKGGHGVCLAIQCLLEEPSRGGVGVGENC